MCVCVTCEDQALPVPPTTITLPFISTSVTLALWSLLLMSAVNVNCADVCGHDAHSAGGLSRHNRQPAPQRCERCNAYSLAIAHTAQSPGHGAMPLLMLATMSLPLIGTEMMAVIFGNHL